MLLADGKVHENEKKVLALEMVKFGVDEAKFEHLWNKALSMDAADAIIFVSNMNDEEKKHVTAFLAAVMASDGNIDNTELALWKLISTLASLPIMTVQEAVKYWMNN